MAEGDLSGPSLADDLYFVMHDGVTGHARLHPRLASLGLAGAVIAELLLAERVAVDLESGRDRLYATGRGAVGDPLAQNVIDHVDAEPDHPLDTWLLFLSRTVYADVQSKMIAAKLLSPPAKRLLKSQQPAPTDTNTAVWPLARLNLAIQRRKPPAVRDCVLYGLCVATGCAQQAMWEHDSAFASAMTATLPAPLQRLIIHTEVAIGRVVISRR
ncbi:GPP34 family phosphoprotein [Microbispora sp. RL4-1S]|uniref:GPP34 family phosphoprotein n=1 Tax=Microbispora oryzae TaxID=2806554 RepID=A0A940WEZ3_9ACTN|nr:GPP34 family phosphoprotein [Microbispora oryzae]MBP2704236.1 GPP34 family phosphoprotein [Microbispora oryzae]